MPLAYRALGAGRIEEVPEGAAYLCVDIEDDVPAAESAPRVVLYVKSSGTAKGQLRRQCSPVAVPIQGHLRRIAQRAPQIETPPLGYAEKIKQNVATRAFLRARPRGNSEKLSVRTANTPPPVREGIETAIAITDAIPRRI